MTAKAVLCSANAGTTVGTEQGEGRDTKKKKCRMGSPYTHKQLSERRFVSVRKQHIECTAVEREAGGMEAEEGGGGVAVV